MAKLLQEISLADFESAKIVSRVSGPNFADTLLSFLNENKSEVKVGATYRIDVGNLTTAKVSAYAIKNFLRQTFSRGVKKGAENPAFNKQLAERIDVAFEKKDYNSDGYLKSFLIKILK